MKCLSRILAELANHGSREGYGLLHFAIEEALKSQPITPSMDTLCKKLVELTGKQNPDTIYRSMARAVDDIWDRAESRPLLKEYYRHEVVEKPTLDDFISALARYLWVESSAQQAKRPVSYHTISEIFSAKYGIVACTEDSEFYAVTPAFTQDHDRAERLVRYLNEQQIPFEQFKEMYLSGIFQSQEM